MLFAFDCSSFVIVHTCQVVASYQAVSSPFEAACPSIVVGIPFVVAASFEVDRTCSSGVIAFHSPFEVATCRPSFTVVHIP